MSIFRLPTSVPQSLPEMWERFREYVRQTEPVIIANVPVGTTEVAVAHGLGEVPGWVGPAAPHCRAIVKQSNPPDEKCVYLKATNACVIDVKVVRAKPITLGNAVKNGGFELADWDPTAGFSSGIYDLTFYTRGLLPSGTSVPLHAHIFERVATFPAGFTGSEAKAADGSVALTGCVLTVKYDGASIGTITFAAGSGTGTISIVSALTTAAGKMLTIHNQAIADAELGNVTITLKGTR